MDMMHSANKFSVFLGQLLDPECSKIDLKLFNSYSRKEASDCFLRAGISRSLSSFLLDGNIGWFNKIAPKGKHDSVILSQNKISALTKGSDFFITILNGEFLPNLSNLPSSIKATFFSELSHQKTQKLFDSKNKEAGPSHTPKDLFKQEGVVFEFAKNEKPIEIRVNHILSLMQFSVFHVSFLSLTKSMEITSLEFLIFLL